MWEVFGFSCTSTLILYDNSRRRVRCVSVHEVYETREVEVEQRSEGCVYEVLFSTQRLRFLPRWQLLTPLTRTAD